MRERGAKLKKISRITNIRNPKGVIEKHKSGLQRAELLEKNQKTQRLTTENQGLTFELHKEEKTRQGRRDRLAKQE